MKALYHKIRTLAGKNYGLYKSLAEKSWDFGDFSLEFLHVQGDPFAPASRVMIKANLQILGYPSEWGVSFERRLALSDFLHRRMSRVVKERYPDKDGAVVFEGVGPEMLVRNSLWIDNGELRAVLQVRLPGEGRKIQAEAASEILTMVLPDLVSASLYNEGGCIGGNRREEGVVPELEAHHRVLADRSAVLLELEKQGLCAFVPDGAVLPRASGISQEPMEGAIPFESPAQMAVTLEVNGRKVRGMGIPKGITVITGGAFHGKSTLLQALTAAVYPHVPGDGREGIVIDETAMRVGVEDGRSVRGTDLSMFVRDLPGGVSTRCFTTAGASGSTSQAANLLEAMEAGVKTFLVDEDSSAVNFLIRDGRVRKLLGDEREPLIPLTDRIREICYGLQEASKGRCSAICESERSVVSSGKRAERSFILVAGACGDYLDIADNIIIMANYKAECARYGANAELGVAHLPMLEVPACRNLADYIQALASGLRPTSTVERQVKVKLNGDTLLQMGFLVSDTSRLVTLFDKQQRLGAGFMLLNLCQNVVSNGNDMATETIMEAVTALCDKIRNVGFRNLPQGMSREMSLPRPVDIACVLFRLRESSRG